MTITPDQLEAARDAISIACGAELLHPHPLASTIDLKRVAEDIAARAGVRVTDARSLAAAGMRTPQFAKLLADAAAPVVRVGFEHQAQHRAFCTPLEVDNFNPVSVPSIDDEVELEPVGENAEIRPIMITTGAGAVSARLTSFARTLRFSRHLVVNDSRGELRPAVLPIGPSAARLEKRMLCETLEAGDSTVLDDGTVVFDGAFSNVEAGALDATTLASAMGKLRTQSRAAGGNADLSLAHLVVAPALELAAMKLLHDHGLSERVMLHAMPWLASGRWYALADPRLAPVVAFLHLRGSAPDAPPVRVEPAKTAINVDGVAIRASADLGVAIVGRVGAVRGGA
jgi:hypothetical protein